MLFCDNVEFHHNEVFKQMVRDIGCILVPLPRYQSPLNVTEYHFRDVKTREKTKGPRPSMGALHGLLSLIDSVEHFKNKSNQPLMKRLGYID